MHQPAGETAAPSPPDRCNDVFPGVSMQTYSIPDRGIHEQKPAGHGSARSVLSVPGAVDIVRDMERHGTPKQTSRGSS